MSEADKYAKTENVKQLIEEAYKKDKLHIDESVHAELRKQQRNITDSDIRDVIFYGFREEDEDRWCEKYQHWKYALRNRDVDECDIRIIFDIENHPDIIVVTVMHVYP